MSFSNSFETTVLNWAFTGNAATRPTAWYIALFTTDPGEASGGTEVSGGGYVRQTVAFSVSGDTATNSAAVEFPEATSSYGTVTHVAIMDASTGGNQIAYAALSASKAIDTGDILRIPAGDLDITLN